uniref:Uncharacterized protein n=1 Tax=Vespula pensylvanica TaxID=30213 RepID=A0A834MYG0_VESPE|nr:hypothetical protein H0235_018216 [Vespula pensylvanica]
MQFTEAFTSGCCYDVIVRPPQASRHRRARKRRNVVSGYLAKTPSAVRALSVLIVEFDRVIDIAVSGEFRLSGKIVRKSMNLMRQKERREIDIKVESIEPSVSREIVKQRDKKYGCKRDDSFEATLRSSVHALPRDVGRSRRSEEEEEEEEEEEKEEEEAGQAASNGGSPT